MSEASSEMMRTYIQESLREYAAFFVHIVEGRSHEVDSAANALRLIEEKARQSLSKRELGMFHSRKSALMGLFRERLFEELKDQVQFDVLEQATDLLKNFEKRVP
jgi:hypothetical protein